MEGESKRYKRGNLIFFLYPKKIYFTTNPKNPHLSQTFILKYRDPFCVTPMHNVYKKVVQGKIRNLEQLSKVTYPDIMWVTTDRRF